MNTYAVILAAGESKRFFTNYPKVLHPILGRPMLEYVLESVEKVKFSPQSIWIVINSKGEKIKEQFKDRANFVLQDPPRGTGDAVNTALKAIKGKGDVLILCGDTPLLSSEILKQLLDVHMKSNNTITFLSACLADPSSYGRVIRDKRNKVIKIVEEQDATLEEKQTREINVGVYCMNKNVLEEFLPLLEANNKQGEYYLPDVINKALESNLKVEAVVTPDIEAALGVNTRKDLALVTEILRRKINENWMLRGVTLMDPGSIFIDYMVNIERDTVIYPCTLIEGNTSIGAGCIIGPFTRIINSKIGNRVKIEASTVEGSIIDEFVTIGPYAHLRPDTYLHQNVKIGNFVEVKKSVIEEGTKASHLSYIGDATIGANVNIGAGTITCNYDGKKKNPTIIKERAFIGSNTALVAPVIVGKGACTGAGAVVTKDIPDYTLVVGVPARKLKELKEEA